MKRILAVIAILASCTLPVRAQTLYLVSTNDYQLDSVPGINSNFTFLFIAGTNAFRTAVEKNSNINYIAKSPTNPTQLDYVLTNGSGSSVDLAGLSNGVINVGLAATGAQSSVIIIGLNATNAQSVANVATTAAAAAQSTASAAQTIANAATTAVGVVRSDLNAASNSLQSQINNIASTNSRTPNAIAASPGNTAVITRASGKLVSLVLTNNSTITFDSSFTTGEVSTVLVQLQAFSYTVSFPTATVHNVGRASSTNLFIATNTATEIVFEKPIGSTRFYPIQLTP